VSSDFFPQISYGVVLLIFVLVSFGPGTQSLDLGVKRPSLDNKRASYPHYYMLLLLLPRQR